jgi:phosphoesterase RecJ-like protein
MSLVHISLLQQYIEDADVICCICHKNPDGDAIGSVLGLRAMLTNMYPNKSISAHCIDAAPASFAYLDIENLQSVDTIQTGATIIFVDTAAVELSGIHTLRPEFFTAQYTTICIDHHATNSGFCTVNIIEPKYASTAEILYEIAVKLHWTITPYAATCLETGLLTDTGGFLHSNTTADTYRTAAALLRQKSAHADIIQHVFKTISFNTLRLWGRVLEKISISPAGAAIAAITSADFASTNTKYSDLSGAIDYVNSIPGMRFSLILSERDGAVKGSLRTLRDDVDVAKMAGAFAGGGHSKAAGFSVPGTLQSVTQWTVVPPSNTLDT